MASTILHLDVPASCPVCDSRHIAWRVCCLNHYLEQTSPEFATELQRQLIEGRAVLANNGNCEDSLPWGCKECDHQWGSINRLKAIGFWRTKDDWGDLWKPHELPDPRRLVRRGWRPAERKRVLAYLQSGHVFARYAGYSYCRFWLCWKLPPQMGDSDMTDGVWVWPQGLRHYLERHWICLPDEFLNSMRSNSWQVPQKEELAFARLRGKRYDMSFWIPWSQQQQRRPWYQLW